jgi:hypothetical protein
MTLSGVVIIMVTERNLAIGLALTVAVMVAVGVAVGLILLPVARKNGRTEN